MNTLPLLSWGLGFIFIVIPLFGFLFMHIFGYGQVLFPLNIIVVSGLLIIANWKGNLVLIKIRSSVQNMISTWNPRKLIMFTLGLGISLRLIVEACFPATLVSDPARYLDLAYRLSAGLDYAAPEGRAYWPPGLPLVLAGLLPIFGTWSITVYNIAAFIIADLVTFALGRMLGGWKVGCVAALVIAVWPNFIFAASFLEKEVLLIVLWPTAVYFYLKAQGALSRGGRIVYSTLAGAAIGYSTLTQPSCLLMLPGLWLFTWLTNRQLRIAAVCVLTSICGFLVIITPWTIRNYTVLHHIVLVGTAGGENFYMVSRLESDGRWGALTQEDQNALGHDELVRNRNGFSLGLVNYFRWPAHSVRTILAKPFYQYGQDIKRTVWVFERGEGGGTTEYVIAYWVANGFYFVVILLILLFVARKEYQYEASDSFLLLWIFMYYPIFAHSLFEASERHRYGTLAIMAIFAAMALCGPGGPSSTEVANPAAA